MSQKNGPALERGAKGQGLVGNTALPSESIPSKGPVAESWALFYGNKRLVIVVPDNFWPDMWRLCWPDGRVSDMANLTRAKDAAEVLCQRGPPQRDADLFSWKIKPLGHALGSPPIGPFASEYPMKGRRAA